MDKERRKKIQATKLVITEIVMLITIVLTVVILTFIVMGYRLTDDGKLEQSGLVDLESIPTGATATIDQDVLPTRTNTSKILPEGDYTVTLQKDGYTSWSHAFTIHSGFLTKLSYPRLYKLDRTPESVVKLTSAPAFLSAAPSRNALLYQDQTGLKLLNLESAKPTPVDLDLTALFPTGLPADLKIISWSENSERALATFAKDNQTHFAVLDLARPSASLDLSATFDLTISDLEFISASGDNLFILENGHLRAASLASEQLSSVLLENVESFDNSGPTAVVVQTTKEGTKKVSLYNYSSKSTVFLKTTTATTARALVSEYLGRTTLVFVDDEKVTIYRGELPTEDVTKDTPLPSPVGEYTLSFTPENLAMVGKNQVFLASKDTNFTVFNLETYSTAAYSLDNTLTFWPDEYIIGTVNGGELIFRDFDGENRQVLAKTAADFPAVITKDNKYLYYLSTDYQITREDIK